MAEIGLWRLPDGGAFIVSEDWMRVHYNRIAGQNLDRLAALSDGVFAIAMTLLVLDLRVPAGEALDAARNGVEHAVWSTLMTLAPNFLVYFMSFLTLGIFWVGQQTQLNHFIHSDRHLAWIHLAFLLAVSLIPFSTGLLAEFLTSRIALLVYWFNVFLLGLALYVSIRYAKRAKLMTDETSLEMHSAHERRIISAQALYAFGTLLCLINTYWSIAIIVFVQLNYAIAPRIRGFDRLFG
jgi:uncharacterized membrane protein